MATEKKLTIPSVLAFERKLDPSDALLFSGNWDDRKNFTAWSSIAIREKAVRGTISNRVSGNDADPAKMDKAIASPNPQVVDVATLPSDSDTLMARFTLRILPGTGIPSACNEADYQAKLGETVSEYVESQGFTELAQRYAHNLASGRFLWRNRAGAEQVEVLVRLLEKGKAIESHTFDALGLSLHSFDVSGEEKAGLDAVAGRIAEGLAGTRHVLLEIIAFARNGAGQEVFPSQELIMNRSRGDKSKTLYKVGDIAGIHSQKIGNALRTIDTWYPSDGPLGPDPIAVEPYGSVTTQGKAYRQPKEGKKDFYSLLDNWLIKDQEPALEQQHFIMATLIRGGVFGKKG